MNWPTCISRDYVWMEGTSELLTQRTSAEFAHSYLYSEQTDTACWLYLYFGRRRISLFELGFSTDFAFIALMSNFMNKSHKLGIYPDKRSLSSALHCWTVYILSSVLTQPADRAQCSAVQPSRPGRAGTWEPNIPCLLRIIYFQRGLFKIICIQLQQALHWCSC